MIVTITNDFQHTGPNVITDLTGYREVFVMKADPEMVGAEKNCCIDNSKLLAEFDDQYSIAGYITVKDGKLPYPVAIFHYWNQCKETGRYWDCTPIGEPMRYYIRLQQ